MRWPSHIAAFLAGALLATALVAQAVPQRRPDRARDRYSTLDTFAQALSHVRSHYADEIGERELLYGAIRGMMERLDPHSAFYPPGRYRQLRQDTEGEFGGVGLLLRAPSQDEPSHPVVTGVVRGSPADRAGLRDGDWIVRVGRLATGGRDGLRRSAESWHSTIRGRAGTRVRLEVMRRGWDRPRQRVLVRERIELPTVESRSAEGVGYVAIERFQEATARDVKAALERLGAERGRIRGLVLDLRDNPGGLLDQAVRVADLFLEEGTIVTVSGRRRSRVERESAHAAGTFAGFPMVVVVDERSASAAEIVAAALQEHGRAEVVGAPTYGKGSVQTFLDLEDGSGLKLTTSRYYTPSGRSLQGGGIKPDVFVPSKGAEKNSVRKRSGDSQLSAAYRTLRKRLRGGRP